MFPSYDEDDIVAGWEEDEVVTPTPDQWGMVIQLLGLLYERYSKGKVGPAHSGYDKALDELMQAYGEWLD